MKYLLLAATLVTPGTVQAQDVPARTIQITGVGVVRTDPDSALISISLRGEGTTPDDATRALAAKQKAVAGGMTGLLGAGTEVTGGNVTLAEAFASNCRDTGGYGGRAQLRTGDCAVIGHVATMQLTVRTPAVTKAGTAAGLAARLGASDARLQGFSLTDRRAAQERAMIDAIASARRQAEGIAKGAGVRLGPIVTITDQANIEVTGARTIAQAVQAPPPPPPPPPPVEIELKPQPIETRAQVFVTFAIAP